MAPSIGRQNAAKRDRVVKHVYDAFAGVRRGPNATSWNESVHIGNEYEGSVRVRRSDRDQDWTERVNDAAWEPFPGLGGFSFVNQEGFLYYLPPAMIKLMHGHAHEWFEGQFLQFIDRHVVRDGRGKWTNDQLRAIAHFIELMACIAGDDASRGAWQTALRDGWQSHL